MKLNIITVKEAIKLIKIDKFENNYSVNFKDEKVDAFDAMLLEKNGIDVPEELIFYDDDKIDFSDIPDISDEDIDSGKLKPVINAHIPINNEIND